MHSTTILLVQPQTDAGTSLRTRLEGKGYTVIETSDATKAVDIVTGNAIALMVSELYMPLGTARCLARVISKSPSHRATKVLAYTTHGRRADRDWARRMGADGYVITRSGEDRFLSVVDHLMETSSTPRRTRTRPRRAQ